MFPEAKRSNHHSVAATALLLAMTQLSGCSALQPRQVPEQTQAAAPVSELSGGPGVKVQMPATTGGGYLAGDGPGADAPANLDAIPDAVPRAEPLHRYANRPYTALGKTYTPLEKTGDYKERGIASWYGKKFHGQRTSIGEVYDMYGMSAAHPTLPIPSYARVTNVANGKSVVVRVNDRGPFLHERIIDLSYTAAYKLDLLGKGSGEVEVESIAVAGDQPTSVSLKVMPPVKVEPIPAEPAMPAPAAVETAGVGKVFLQLGAFRAQEGAESFLARLRSDLGENGKQLSLYQKDGLTRVQFGPFANADEARSEGARLAGKLGFKPFVSVR